jgi:hypothetical protein
MNAERIYPITFIISAAIGAIIGKVTGYGTIRGLTVGMLIAALPIFLLIIGYLFLMRWRPDLPNCRCGQCKYKNYQFVGQTGLNKADTRLRFKCPKCGRTYELFEARFDELTPDSHIVPYMGHSKWGRWMKAEAKQTSADKFAKSTAPEK